MLPFTYLLYLIIWCGIFFFIPAYANIVYKTSIVYVIFSWIIGTSYFQNTTKWKILFSKKIQ